MSEFNQETKSETTLDNFKEELWNTVVKFGEPVLMGTGLDEKAIKELLSKMVKLRETRQKTKDDECKDGSTLKQKTDDKMIKVKEEDKIKTSTTNILTTTNIHKARAGGGKNWKGQTGTERSNQRDSDDAPKQMYKVSKEETGGRGVEQPVGGCCLREELEGDCPHDPSAVEDCSLQE